MTFDFYKYLFFLNRNEGISLIINLLIFSISLVTLIYSNQDYSELFTEFNISVLILVAYSLFNFIWDLIGKYQEIQGFTGKNPEIEMTSKTKLIKDDHVFNFGNITGEQRGTWTYENYSPDGIQHNTVIRSKEIDVVLWDKDFELKVTPNREKVVREFILKNKEIITPFFQYKYFNSKKNNQLFFNESKLCMGSDFNPKSGYINCFKGSYFNSFLTNEISSSALKRTSDAIVIYDASNFYPCKYNHTNEKYDLHNMDSDTPMNNHIGVSTLAITKDNYLVIRKQGSSSLQNINKYVPTGSGSCDWTDIQGDSFIATIKYAMKRELWEENGGKEIGSSINEFGETKVLGYFRWLKRGGKPEFVGITRLNYDLNELNPNQEELVNLSTKHEKDTFYIESMNDLSENIETIKDMENISLPLAITLDALQRYCTERPAELNEFLNL